MRFRLLLALVALTSTAAAASAQSARHPLHRTLLMPTVTAATSCIAQMVVANASASSLARNGQWLAAIRAIGDVCDPALRRMEATYDQLYGLGSGRQFLTGAYAADVPRAVAIRVQPHFDRSAVSNVRTTVQTPPPAITAEEQKLLSAAAAEHWQCIEQSMVELVPFSANQRKP